MGRYKHYGFIVLGVALLNVALDVYYLRPRGGKLVLFGQSIYGTNAIDDPRGVPVLWVGGIILLLGMLFLLGARLRGMVRRGEEIEPVRARVTDLQGLECPSCGSLQTEPLKDSQGNPESLVCNACDHRWPLS